MSITEWVLSTYNTNDQGLEEAKNFTFIWSLFENQSRTSIFATDTMKISEFKAWNNKLDIKQKSNGLVIKDVKTGNEISGKLVDEINKSFNHFYQKYMKDDIYF